MQDVDEHMDDLFRKAADNYMLKDGESNWNEIAGQLELSVVSSIPGANKNTHTGKYIITAALLLLCFIAGIMFTQYESKNKATTAITIQQKTKVNTDHREEKTSLSKERAQQDKGVTYGQLNAEQLNENNTQNKPPGKDVVIDMNVDENSSTHNNNTVSSVTQDFSLSSITKNKSQISTSQTAQSSALLNSKAVDIKQPLPKDSAPKNTTIKLTVKNNLGIYYGLLAGAGFTTVKSQSFSEPGIDVGIVTGYRLSARSSVEMNLLYTHKYYYSDGKYFSMDKMKNDMPADMKLMSVKGNSSIIEIPLKFKYNVWQKKNNTVYTAAGVSSYILINEKNNYVTSVDGTMGNMYGNYTNTSGYFAGAINISAGYEHALKQNATIRVEPYISIPVKGIGMGSLPITTSGVHVLFTIAPRK